MKLTQRIGLFLFWAAAFGISFTQWPLYSENQNTKFLQGVASGGMGHLGNDWLANTIDPLPVFSTLVFLTYRFGTPLLFYLFHALLLGLYLYALGAICSYVFPLRKTAIGLPLFYVAVIAFHSSLLPPFSLPAFGTSVGWLVQAGVANQYLLNPVLQPSTFGVLLVLAIWLFLDDKPYWAAASASIAAIIHSTYLPHAAALTIAFVLLNFWAERNIKKALGIGLLSLALVVPILLYNSILLGPTSAELWARSQDIIVNFRIPHHSVPEMWMNDTVYVKIGIVIVALLLTIRSRLFSILLICFAIAVGLTALQMQIDNDTLAFTAPWRISVFLVPLSTALIIAAIIAFALSPFEEQIERGKVIGWAVCLILLGALVFRGTQAIRDSFEARANNGLAQLWQFAKDTKLPDSVYLVPTHMAEFRLATGVPVVVTFKSHPYKDVEVIEWQNRVAAVNDFYANISCEGIENLAATYGVTDVVLERVQFFDGCDSITNVHLDDRFGVFRVNQ